MSQTTIKTRKRKNEEIDEKKNKKKQKLEISDKSDILSILSTKTITTSKEKKEIHKTKLSNIEQNNKLRELKKLLVTYKLIKNYLNSKKRTAIKENELLDYLFDIDRRSLPKEDIKNQFNLLYSNLSDNCKLLILSNKQRVFKLTETLDLVKVNQVLKFDL
jgi:hypothetical protein